MAWRAEAVSHLAGSSISAVACSDPAPPAYSQCLVEPGAPGGRLRRKMKARMQLTLCCRLPAPSWAAGGRGWRTGWTEQAGRRQELHRCHDRRQVLQLARSGAACDGPHASSCAAEPAGGSGRTCVRVAQQAGSSRSEINSSSMHEWRWSRVCCLFRHAVLGESLRAVGNTFSWLKAPHAREGRWSWQPQVVQLQQPGCQQSTACSLQERLAKQRTGHPLDPIGERGRRRGAAVVPWGLGCCRL